MLSNTNIGIDPSTPIKDVNSNVLHNSNPSSNIPRTTPKEFKVPSLQELVYDCYINQIEESNKNLLSTISTSPKASSSISFKSNMFSSSNNINSKYQDYFNYKNFEEFVNKKHCSENLEFLVSIQKYEKLWNELFHMNSNCLSCRKRLSTITPESSNRFYSSNGPKRSLKSSFSSDLLKSASNSTLYELDSNNHRQRVSSITPRSSLSYLNSLNLELNRVSNVESFIDLKSNTSNNSSQHQWFNEPEMRRKSSGTIKHKLDDVDDDDGGHHNEQENENCCDENHIPDSDDPNHCSCGESHKLNQNLIDLNDLYFHIIKEFITEDAPNQISLPYKIQDLLIKEAEEKTNSDLKNCSINPNESHDPKTLLSAKDYVMSLLSQNVYKNFVQECESKIEEDKLESTLNITSIRGPCGVLNPEIIRPVRGPCGITNPLLAQPINEEQKMRSLSPSPLLKHQSAPLLRSHHHHTTTTTTSKNSSPSKGTTIVHDKKCALYNTDSSSNHPQGRHRHSNPENGHSHLLGLKSLKSRIIKIHSTNNHECTCNGGNGITNNNSSNGNSGLFRLRPQRNNSHTRKFSSSSSNSTTTSNTSSSRDSSPSLSPIMNDATMKLSQLSLNSNNTNAHQFP